MPAKNTATESDTLTTFGAAGKFIREVGLPTALLFALGWVSVNYWIKPQTKLIEAMTEANITMADTYKALADGMKENHDQLVDILDETKQTTQAMESAYKLMQDVPSQRAEELALARDNNECMKEFTTAVTATHNQQIDEHKQILDKLDQ